MGGLSLTSEGERAGAMKAGLLQALQEQDVAARVPSGHLVLYKAKIESARGALLMSRARVKKVLTLNPEALSVKSWRHGNCSFECNVLALELSANIPWMRQETLKPQNPKHGRRSREHAQHSAMSP